MRRKGCLGFCECGWRRCSVIFRVRAASPSLAVGSLLKRPCSKEEVVIYKVGGDEIAERSPKAIKRDFRALGRLVEGSGAQVVFSSIPSVAGDSTERGRKTHLVNRWLRVWCHRSNFGFFDHGEVHQACWRQVELSYLKGGKEFLATSWRGSLRGL